MFLSSLLMLLLITKPPPKSLTETYLVINLFWMRKISTGAVGRSFVSLI